MSKKDENQKRTDEISSKIWNKDISTLSNIEINELITNMFYQLFLVDISSIISTFGAGENGITEVGFVIKGECWRDASGLDSSEISNLLAHEELDEFDESEDEE